jgi:L-threonylcarbamoyladenylate synthase
MLPFRTESDVDRAIPVVRDHLGRGGLLAYPTETVYGLGSTIAPASLRALATLKGRPERKPFLLLVADQEMATRSGLTFNASAAALAAAFWPGPLTLVLPGGEGVLPDALRGAEDGIAVRHSGHALVTRLVRGLGYPLTSTSANRPGQFPAPGPDRIAEVFREAVEAGQLLILDGGVLGNVPPSTVVDCTRPAPRLVREGALPRAELRRAVGRLSP